MGEDPQAEVGQGPGREQGGRGKGWPYPRVGARTTMVQGSGGPIFHFSRDPKEAQRIPDPFLGGGLRLTAQPALERMGW